MRTVTVTFPVVRYFPKHLDGGHVMYCAPLNSPTSLAKTGRLPLRSNFVPGGILDATGLDIAIVDVHGVHDTRPWWALLSELTIGMFGHHHVTLEFGAPKQLTVDQFRKKFIGLLIKEKGFGRSIKEIQVANSYLDILAAQWGRDFVGKYNPPLTMQIEVPDPQ